jgi:hypothetical protein
MTGSVVPLAAGMRPHFRCDSALRRAPLPPPLCRCGWPGKTGLNTGLRRRRQGNGLQWRLSRLPRPKACPRRAEPHSGKLRQAPVRRAELADVGYDVDTVLTGASVEAIKFIEVRAASRG